MVTSVAMITTPQVRGALTRLGRTEDVRFAPSGRRLVIAGFGRNELNVLDIDIADDASSVTVTGMIQVTSACLHEPHGVCFLDDHTVVVANRDAEVPIFHLPPVVPGLRQLHLDPVQTLRADEIHGLKSPGSVIVSRLAPDLHQLLVCNNDADTVTRHVLDGRDGYRVLSSEVLAGYGLQIPDGVAISADGCWMAISNHNTHSVFIHRFSEDLGPSTWPAGRLENVNYPHGLCFSADGAHLIVADAGSPYVHTFTRGDDDWGGVRQPASMTRVMDDAAFLSGRYNVQEGGAKGIDLDPSMRLVAVSSEHQPLSFFAATDLVAGIGAVPDRHAADTETAAGEATRVALIRAMRAASVASDRSAAIENTIADHESTIAALEEASVGRDAQLAELAALVDERSTQLAAVESRLMAERVAHDEDIAWLFADRDNALATAGYARAVIADRDHQLAAIRSSRWWRLTALPRWCVALGRRCR